MLLLPLLLVVYLVAVAVGTGVESWQDTAEREAKEPKLIAASRKLDTIVEAYFEGMLTSDAVARSMDELDASLKQFGNVLSVHEFTAMTRERDAAARKILDIEKGRATSVEAFLSNNAKLIAGMKKRGEYSDALDRKIKKEIEARIKSE